MESTNLEEKKALLYYSSYLSAYPTFLSGIARILDFGNTFDTYNNTSNGEQADSIGMLWDWSIVGKDLWNSINTVKNSPEIQSSEANWQFKSSVEA